MSKPFLLGLTGSIGMGKSTTAKLFADRGIPVWDADRCVHRLYDKGGKAVEAISKLVPDVVQDGRIDRSKLARWLGTDPDRFSQLESIVHPLVALERTDFIARNPAPIVVLDIPLLFETAADHTVDAIAVVSTSEANQRQRVLDRPGMTEDRFQQIQKRQIPDAEKRRRADYVIDTSTPASAIEDVEKILKDIRKIPDARNCT